MTKRYVAGEFTAPDGTKTMTYFDKPAQTLGQALALTIMKAEQAKAAKENPTDKPKD